VYTKQFSLASHAEQQVDRFVQLNDLMTLHPLVLPQSGSHVFWYTVPLLLHCCATAPLHMAMRMTQRSSIALQNLKRGAAVKAHTL
jgi:hypothetical protein